MTMRWTAAGLALALAGTLLVNGLGLANEGLVPSAAALTPTGRGVTHSSGQLAAAPLPSVMADTEKGAVRVVNGFWKRHFKQLSTRTYRAPEVKGGYQGSDGPSCAGRPSVAFNAFYCRPGDYLAWDEKLMAAGYEKIGDSWVYLIIAHEWGHAIQDRAGLAPGRFGVELQADCLAGATLQGAANDGLVKVDPGDAEELQRTLAAAADDYPWTNEGDHGNADQRIGAFRTGAQRGLTACF